MLFPTIARTNAEYKSDFRFTMDTLYLTGELWYV